MTEDLGELQTPNSSVTRASALITNACHAPAMSGEVCRFLGYSRLTSFSDLPGTVKC